MSQTVSTPAGWTEEQLARQRAMWPGYPADFVRRMKEAFPQDQHLHWLLDQNLVRSVYEWFCEGPVPDTIRLSRVAQLRERGELQELWNLADKYSQFDQLKSEFHRVIKDCWSGSHNSFFHSLVP